VCELKLLPSDMPPWLIRQIIGLAFGFAVPDHWAVSVTNEIPGVGNG